MLRNFILLILFLFASEVNAQRISPPVPADIYPYQFEKKDSVFSDYFLTVMYQNKKSPGEDGFVAPQAAVIDKNGYLAWYMHSPQALISDLKYFPQTRQFGLVSYLNVEKTIYYVLDTNLRITDSITNSPGIISDAHEFLVLANGNMIIGGEYDTVMDLRKEIFNQKPGDDSVKVRCYVIEEFDRNHKLVFQWKSIDHVPPSESYVYLYGYNRKGFDYCHGNSIALDTDGNLLVSFRNLNAVYKIDHQSGKIIWQLGGKHSSFRFADDKHFSGQHDFRLLPNGNYGVYDNATETPELKASSASEYKIDTKYMVAQRRWEYHYAPYFHSPSQGSYQLREDGYRLINCGFVFRPDPSIVLLDPREQIGACIYFQDSIKAYRSYISNAGKFIRRPKVYAEMLGEKIRLTAEAGFGSYLWSTGDTSASILVSKTGTYQVWVPYGIGHAGSEAVIVRELNGNYPEGTLTLNDEDNLLLFTLLGTALLIGTVVFFSERKV